MQNMIAYFYLHHDKVFFFLFFFSLILLSFFHIPSKTKSACNFGTSVQCYINIFWWVFGIRKLFHCFLILLKRLHSCIVSQDCRSVNLCHPHPILLNRTQTISWVPPFLQFYSCACLVKAAILRALSWK